MSKEYVYCITNPMIPNICKCGGTKRIPTDRCRELSNTSLPVNCKLEYFIEVSNWKESEKYIHDKLVENGFKRYDKREWFECKPDEIKFIFDKCKNFSNELKLIKTTSELSKDRKPIKKMEYKCKECNYTTKIKRDFEKHKLTNKHIQNTRKIYICTNCNMNFQARTTCYLHRKQCKNLSKDKLDIEYNSNTDIDNKILKEELETEQIMAKIELLKLKSKYDKEQIELLKSLVSNSNKIREKALDIADKL